jgi:hypothetical protein
MEKFDTSEEFFDWFLSEISTYVPNYKELVIGQSQKQIVNGLPNLTSDEIEYTFSEIRKTINIPSNVYLVYDTGIETYASLYNDEKKRLEIVIPTYAFYHLRYDPIIKAAIQHEMGHILNRDYKVDTRGHSGCANRCMDIRINHHIDRVWLRDLFDAVYYFKVTKFNMLVPEETLGNYGLPPRVHGSYGYQVIHKAYHDSEKQKKPKQKKPPMEYNMPNIGDVVKINKTSDYGKVVDIKDGKAVVEKMTIEEVQEHFKQGDDRFNEEDISKEEAQTVVDSLYSIYNDVPIKDLPNDHPDKIDIRSQIEHYMGIVNK